MKSFYSGVICSENPKLGALEVVKQAPCTLRAGYRSRDALQLERYCLLHAVVQGSGSFQGQLFCTTYGWGATGRQNCPIFGFWHIFPCKTPKKYLPVSLQPRVTSQNDSNFSRDSRRSKGMPSGTGFFLRLLIGELWTPKLSHGASDLDQMSEKA